MGIPVIKFMFRREWKVLSDASQLNPVCETMEVSSASDLITHLSGNSAGMIIISIQEKNDLIQLATLVKLSKKLSPGVLLKVMVINFSGDKQFEKAIIKLGILDLIDHRIQTKALRFKIDFMMKSLTAHMKKASAPQAAATQSTARAVDQSKAPERLNLSLVPTWESSFEGNDIWILKNETDCKRVLTRWLVKFLGPGPYVASWVETDSRGTWKFEFKSLKEQFITGDGAWYFRGEQKPDFIWAENIWSMTGSEFELYFRDSFGQSPRVQLKDKQLRITKNSETAKSKEEHILKSLNKDFLFGRDQGTDSAAKSIEVDPENFRNLKGKSSTDHLDWDPLSGKNKTEALDSKPLSGKSSTSHLNTDPLKLDLEPGEKNSSSDPLSMESSNEKKSTYWKGKNTYEKDAPKELGLKTDARVDQGPELGLATSREHKKYYKNRNEAEKFQERDLGHAVKKDGVGENLKGKSSTDEIEGHLSSPEARTEKSKGSDRAEFITKKFDDRKETPKLKTKKPAELTLDTEEDLLETPVEKMKVETKEKTIPIFGPKRDRSPAASKAEEEADRSRAEESNIVDISSRRRDPAVAETKKPEPTGSSPQEVDQNFDDASGTATVTVVLTQGLLKESCQLDDFFDKTMIFRTPSAGFEVEKPISVYMKFSYHDKDTLLNCDGLVTLVEVPDELIQYVSVRVSQDSDRKARAFMELFKNRQENIDFFLKTVKGN